MQPTTRKMLSIMLAGVIPCLTLAAETISVSGNTYDAHGKIASLTLAFPAQSHPTCLWLASGRKDGGGTPGGWEHVDFVAEIPAGTTSCVWSADGMPGNVSAMRFFLMEDSTEYTQLESVSATGSQYAIFGYTPTGTTAVRCDFRFDNVSAASAIFSARTTSYKNGFCVLHTTDHGFRFDYDTMVMNTDKKPVAGTRYLAEMDYSGLKVNGVSLKFTDPSYKPLAKPASFTAGSPFTLFALNSAGSIGSHAPATVYSCQVWSDVNDAASIVLNLVPCKKGDAVGFYNLKDGSFKPANAGSFGGGAERAHNPFGSVDSASALIRPYGEDRTMTVKRFYCASHRVKADLGFSASYSACTLFVAYGPEDAGNAISGWANAVCLGAVPADATSLTVTIPSAIDETMGVFRFFLFPRYGSASYDQVFEAVRATGTQYVLTGLTPTGLTHVMAEFSLDAVEDVQVLFSARTEAYKNAYSFLHTKAQGYRIDYNYGIANAGTGEGCVANPGVPFRIDMSPLGFLVNGKSHFEGLKNVATNFTAGAQLTLFAMNSAGTVGSCAQSTCCRYFKAWTKVGHEETRVLDLLPCARNGVVGFYNKVDGRFFGNDSGMGEFEAAGDELPNPNLTPLVVTEPLPLPPPPGLMIIVL